MSRIPYDRHVRCIDSGRRNLSSLSIRRDHREKRRGLPAKLVLLNRIVEMAEVVDDEEAAAAGIGVGSAIEQVVLSPYAEPLVARPDEEEEAGAE